MATKKSEGSQERVSPGTVVVPLLVALFIGFMCVVATGFFAHSIYNVAAPVVCKDGELEIEAVQYSTEDGGVGVSNEITCVAGGTRTDISNSAQVATGLIFSAGFAVVLVPLWFYLMRSDSKKKSST